MKKQISEQKPIDFKKRNARFAKLSNAQKRVAIARDVLKQIQTENFIPHTGKFVSVPDYNEFLVYRNKNASLQEMLPQLGPCDVCALGGLFLSCTNLNNKARVSALMENSHPSGNIDNTGEAYQMNDMFLGGKKFSNDLNRFFSNYQLMLIEIAFERGGGAVGNVNFTDGLYKNYLGQFKPITAEIEAAAQFSEKTNTDQSSKDRMIAIMKNIIRNKGRFRP
jgi:hypothetical protein